MFRSRYVKKVVQSYVFAAVSFCIYSYAAQAPGTWVNVMAPTMRNTGDAYYNGPVTVLKDPAKPADVYANVAKDGTWKSTDYGVTWTKVSTGVNGDQQDQSSQSSAIIDPNPNRNPSTPPTIMVNQFGGGRFMAVDKRRRRLDCCMEREHFRRRWCY